MIIYCNAEILFKIMNLIFLDTETTGVDPKKDRLCQISYRIGDKTKTEYFKPPLPMSIKAMSITHITNKMLEDKEVFIESKIKKDLKKLLTDGILIAHNAKFDIAMLEAEGLSVPKNICTLRVARYLDKEGVIPEHNLQFLRYYLSLEVEGDAHNAEGDVNVLYALFERLLSKIKKTIGSEKKAIEKMIEISNTPSLFVKFSFGKYKGKKLEEIGRAHV